MNKRIKLKIVGGDVGDKNYLYDPTAPETEEYKLVQSEVMKRIENSYILMDTALEGLAEPQPSKENDWALPDTDGKLLLLAPVSGG